MIPAWRAILFVLFAAGVCLAQSSYSGLTPGVSTRADTERVLGTAVRAISETLVEYSGRQNISKIYVQYRPNNGPMERIEILLSTTQTADQIFREAGLPLESPESSKVNSKGKLEELYSGSLLVLTYKTADRSSGVDRIGYYSKALFAIAVKQSGNAGTERPPNPPPVTGKNPIPPPDTTTTPYDQLTMGAWEAMLARDFTRALDLLQQATRKEPQKGIAYSYLGIAYLYGYGDIPSAEKAMREALSKNDRATFRVHHDHSGTFQYFCYGWLYIGTSEVQFQSDEGHGFHVDHSEIKEAKLNNLVGAGYSAFHIKARGSNYNLAPGSLKLPETNLILTLIRE